MRTNLYGRKRRLGSVLKRSVKPLNIGGRIGGEL
jgi:hypothetical protein